MSYVRAHYIIRRTTRAKMGVLAEMYGVDLGRVVDMAVEMMFNTVVRGLSDSAKEKVLQKLQKLEKEGKFGKATKERKYG